MDNVQRCSFLWSSDSDPSRAPLNQTENDSASLLLLLLNDIGYTQYLHSEEQDYKVYEIELKNDRDIAKLKFPDEVEIGKYEYKVKLTGLTPFRLATLASQMKWRIEEGTSETYYELGVSNSGHVKGLVDTDLRESMNNIRRVCSIIDAKIISIKRLQIKLAIKPRYICEVKLSLPEKIKLPPNKRVFLLGGPETGKTSLVGVLSKSITDDGHGRARMGFFTHAHEIKTGKTSSIAFNLLGFTEKQKVVNYQIHDTQDQICKNSDFTITLIDSCGLERYFDTTIKGLTGAFPSTIFYMVNPALQAKHEIEFLKIASSWPCPLFVIFTHFDKVDPSDVENSFHRISNIIQSLSIQKLVYINNLDEMKKFEAQRLPTEIAAFSISHVTWQNLDIVLYLLYNLASDSIQVQSENEVTQFAINTIYNIPDCGLVVSGILLSGVIKEGDDVYLGPLDDEFHLLKVQSLRSFRVTCPMLYPDQLGTIALGSSITVKNRSKKGMYLLSAHPQEFKRSYFANITEKYRHLIEDCGSNVNLYISNLYASAVIKIVSLEDKKYDDDDYQVEILTPDRNYYIPEGSIAVFKLKKELLTMIIKRQIT